jgi:hypothetical protein
MPRIARRLKLSTTVDPETHGYLHRLVKIGRVKNVAEAIDQVVLRAKRAEQRSRLEQDTAAYFQALEGAVAKEESRLDAAVAQMAGEADFGD